MQSYSKRRQWHSPGSFLLRQNFTAAGAIMLVLDVVAGARSEEATEIDLSWGE